MYFLGLKNNFKPCPRKRNLVNLRESFQNFRQAPPPFYSSGLYVGGEGHGICELFFPYTKLTVIGRKPGNSSLLKLKSTKEIRHHRGTRMVKDEDY